MAWRIEEILAATGGRVQYKGKKNFFGEVVTDSSKVEKNAVFIALKGARFDGHRFVGAAARRGAACCIVARDLPRRVFGGATAIRVKDTLRALGDLARHRRDRLAPKIVAITGSNGKTTTKEMLAAILEEESLDGARLRGKVLKTEGNFNNLVGLPLTLLRLRPAHKVAVVEMGTNRPGEIQRLAEIASPDMAVITSVAPAHLEGLRSLAGVAREKGALYQAVPKKGTIAVNLDDPWVRRLAASFKGRKISYGKRGRVRAEKQLALDAAGARFTLRANGHRCNVRLNYLGRHNVANAVGAAALAYGMGARLPAIRRGLAKAKPFAMRMELERWRGIGIINDAYNANPASMAAALETLAAIGGRGARVAVLGDMFELGREGRRQHFKLGALAARARIDGLYLLGKRAAEVRRGALRGGMAPENIVIGRNHRDLARRLGARLKERDWILLKGSRGMEMERVLAELKRQRPGE